MPRKIQENQIAMEQRQALIFALPCFAILTPEEAHELANLMHEIDYQPGEVIVTEHALVDSVFIVVQGQAEVTREYAKKRRLIKKVKLIQVPVATLGPGDAIGLNDTGFFSQTGKRTATVTAITETRVLEISLENLHQFLQSHPRLQPAMSAIAEQMLKAKLIKQSLAFNRLSHERLQWLSEKVEEVTVPAGMIIFNQGETGDRCYLISSGRVEIFSKDEDGIDRHLAFLTPPTLFGEATLITGSPRNATARATEDCRLLMLRYEYLSELLETESNVAETFMTLMVDRSRPLCNPLITTHQRTSVDGQEIVILKNPETGSYFKLSAEGWFIWQQLDGQKTMQEITLALAAHSGLFAPDIVAALISRLARSGFITQVETGASNTTIKNQPVWVRYMLHVRRILEARIAIGDTDKALTVLYQKGFFLFFTKIGKLILTALSILGIAVFAFSSPEIISTFQLFHNTWLLLVLLIPCTVLTVVLHELGHAFATKAFGHEVHYMGVGWYWLGPIAFTDTSDMWLSTRWPRIVVNLAGICTDIIVASIAALTLIAVDNPYLQAFIWLFALFTYINAFRMLSPLQDWDGYYVLMDLLDRPRLRQSAVVWLAKTFPKSLRHPSLFKKYTPEACYWLACIVFLFLVSVATLLIQGFIFKIIGIHANVLISLILPFLVVLISCLGIVADLRGQK